MMQRNDLLAKAPITLVADEPSGYQQGTAQYLHAVVDDAAVQRLTAGIAMATMRRRCTG
jgi:hypothetical protein